jgi:hypothetical protein
MKRKRLDEATRAMLGWDPVLEREWEERRDKREHKEYKRANRKNIIKKEEAAVLRENPDLRQTRFENFAYANIDPIEEEEEIDIMGTAPTRTWYPDPLDYPRVIEKTIPLTNKNYMQEMLRSGRKFTRKGIKGTYEADPYEAGPGQPFTYNDQFIQDYLDYGRNANQKQNLRRGPKVFIKRNLKTKKK